MSDKPAQMKPVPLSQSRHKGLRIKSLPGVNHIKRSKFARLNTWEFPRAGLDTPIVFLKGPNDQYFTAAIWGFENDENLFVDEDGMWTGGYMPTFARAFPFAVLPDPEKDEHFYVGIFEDSEYVSREEGQLIINEDGTRTEKMEEMQTYLAHMYQQDRITAEFTKKMVALNLLVPQTLMVKDPVTGETRDSGGFYIIDPAKVGELSESVFLELRNEGWLQPIYAHIMSLQTLDKLARRKGENTVKAAAAETA